MHQIELYVNINFKKAYIHKSASIKQHSKLISESH